MWVDPEDDPREKGGTSLGDERETYAEYLRCQRLTLEMKCAGLTAQQMALRSVQPSAMSLLGLVRHLADVERSWFRIRLAGEPVERRFREAGDRDADFNGAVGDDAVVEEAWQAWREEVAFAEQWVANNPDMARIVEDPRNGPLSTREVLVHMVEEYARHNGHADLLRERIDGATGQ
jgi:uncharacterized damage-inducible protein DinB